MGVEEIPVLCEDCGEFHPDEVLDQTEGLCPEVYNEIRYQSLWLED